MAELTFWFRFGIFLFAKIPASFVLDHCLL